jgi:hypothetical protein
LHSTAAETTNKDNETATKKSKKNTSGCRVHQKEREREETEKTKENFNKRKRTEIAIAFLLWTKHAGEKSWTGGEGAKWTLRAVELL